MRNQTRPGSSKRHAAGSDASLVSFLLSARLQDVSVPMLQCSILPVHHQEEHPRGHQAALRGGHQRDPSHHCRDLQNVPRREFARSVVPDPPSVLTVLCVCVCVPPPGHAVLQITVQEMRCGWKWRHHQEQQMREGNRLCRFCVQVLQLKG